MPRGYNMKRSPSDLLSLILGLGINTCSNVCVPMPQVYEAGEAWWRIIAWSVFVQETSLITHIPWAGLCQAKMGHYWDQCGPDHYGACVFELWIFMYSATQASQCAHWAPESSVAPWLLLTSKDGEDNTTGGLNEMCPIVSVTWILSLQVVVLFWEA